MRKIAENEKLTFLSKEEVLHLLTKYNPLTTTRLLIVFHGTMKVSVKLCANWSIDGAFIAK